VVGLEDMLEIRLKTFKKPLALAAASRHHSIMHGAAVTHGMETTIQLPPHY